MGLVPHIGRIVRTGGIDVSVSWGEPIAYNAETDRKVLARELETSVRSLTVAALRGDMPLRPVLPVIFARQWNTLAGLRRLMSRVG